MPYVPGAVVHGVTHVADVYHSANVYANFVNIALWNDPQGAEAASLAAIASPTYKIDAATITLDGETDEGAVTAGQAQLVAAGTVTQKEIDAGNGAGDKATTTDTTPGVVSTGTVDGSVTLASSIDDTLLYDSPLTGTKYYVKTVTKQPGVIFPYDVASLAESNGTTVQAVVDNLRLLVINCWDPIKKQYPDAFMTCSFRKKGVGSGTSQHPLGMACDIQYSKASKADYYTRAEWVKNNITYDQFLLEYKTTGSGLPWHHISFNKAGNRAQVCTFMNDKNCKGPGVIGLYDLANA